MIGLHLTDWPIVGEHFWGGWPWWLVCAAGYGRRWTTWLTHMRPTPLCWRMERNVAWTSLLLQFTGGNASLWVITVNYCEIWCSFLIIINYLQLSSPSSSSSPHPPCRCWMKAHRGCFAVVRRARWRKVLPSWMRPSSLAFISWAVTRL